MNTNEILRKLHGLAAEDRDWIIARLPSRAKAQLLATGPDERAPHMPTFEVPQPDEGVPGDVDVTRLAAILASEPSWIAAVLLDGCVQPWAAAVCERLPLGMRADIASLHRSGGPLTAHAKRVLIRTVLARIGGAESAPVRSKFQGLLARLSASRSRRRLTIHL